MAIPNTEARWLPRGEWGWGGEDGDFADSVSVGSRYGIVEYCTTYPR